MNISLHIDDEVSFLEHKPDHLNFYLKIFPLLPPNYNICMFFVKTGKHCSL